ncbi:MAG: sugar transferase [Caldilineaceae bacterium]
MLYGSNMQANVKLNPLDPPTPAFDLNYRESTIHAANRQPLSERLMLLLSGDVLCLILALAIANLYSRAIATQASGWQWSDFFLLPWVFIAWLGFALLNDLYDVVKVGSYRFNLGGLAIIAAQCALLPLALFLFALPTSFVVFLTIFLVTAIALLAVWRVFCVWFFRSFGTHRLLIVGTNERAQKTASLLAALPGLNYTVLGFVNDNHESKDADDSIPMPSQQTNVIGEIADLPRLAADWGADEVVLAMDRPNDQSLFNLLLKCQSRGIRISVAGEIYERMERYVALDCIDASWVSEALKSTSILSRVHLFAKRVLDLTIGLLALPWVLLIMAAVAIAVRLDSPGSVFYCQTRSGQGGKPFTIWKFRTMVNNAEREGKPQWAIKGDARITRVGRVLRKTRLDELPQLINILKGDMSLVGPRPERPEFIRDLQRAIPFFEVRLVAKPGLTGWAQIHYDYGNTVEDAKHKLQYDLYYIRHWSIWMDLYVLYRTIYVVLMQKGL